MFKVESSLGYDMKDKISNRQFISAAIIVFYLIPFLFFSAYNIRLMSHHKSWTLLSLGLLIIALGTLSLIFLLSYWEQSIREKNFTRRELPQNSSILFLPENETKVTLLNPSMTFASEIPEKIDNPSGEIKELNLLQTALQLSQKQQEELAILLESKEKRVIQCEEENHILQMKALQIAQDYADYKLFSEEQLKQKQMQLVNFQQIVEDQRSEMEKRQEQIHHLDSKIHDLSYEIKTLLHLDQEEINTRKSALKEEKNIASIVPDEPLLFQEKEKDLPIAIENGITSQNGHFNSNEADQLLKKCIQIAQKFTGTNYYSNESPRYREFSSSFFAIDQRRLFDHLRGETGALVVMFSQKDHKPLFVNIESKSLLGWSPDKFLSDFASIMQESLQDWKKTLLNLNTAQESQARFLAKTRQGNELLLNCHLGIVPSGLFRNYVIGVLYPT